MPLRAIPSCEGGVGFTLAAPPPKARAEAPLRLGQEKLAWLRRFAPFKNGIPSHDCIANLVARLSPKGFQECFCSWTRAATKATGGEVIAVDGETARGSRDRTRSRHAPQTRMEPS